MSTNTTRATPPDTAVEAPLTPSTAEQLSEFIGKDGTIELGGLAVAVEIHDARHRFGHVDVKVTPKAGTGTAWVEHNRVALAE